MPPLQCGGHEALKLVCGINICLLLLWFFTLNLGSKLNCSLITLPVLSSMPSFFYARMCAQTKHYNPINFFEMDDINFSKMNETSQPITLLLLLLLL